MQYSSRWHETPQYHNAGKITIMFDLQFPYRLANFFRHFKRALYIRTRQQYGEFFSTVACRQIAGSSFRRLDYSTDLP
jgi:hypothetical protein